MNKILDLNPTSGSITIAHVFNIISIYFQYRDDVQKKHPCLTTFERLPASERQYDITLAFETLRTLLALGYHISVDNMDPARRMKYQKLPAR